MCKLDKSDHAIVPVLLFLIKIAAKKKIVNFDAPRPSKKEILYNEIKALLHTY